MANRPPRIRIPLSSPEITAADIQAVTDVLSTSSLSLGPKLAEFERALAAYVGASQAVAVSSGTAGLQLCLRAMGLAPGEEVVTTSFTVPGVLNAIVQEGGVPVFADISPLTLNLDPVQVKNAIGSNTRGIIAVHTFGRPAPMAALREIADSHRLFLIEDACEAIGALYRGKRVGTVGDASVFAFYPNKQITLGEGGAVATCDAGIAERIMRLRNQGRDPSLDWLDQIEAGFNYRLSELQCALGIAQLDRIESILRQRKTVAERYHRRLVRSPLLALPALDIDDGAVSWFVFVVRLADGFSRADRDWIVASLLERGIQCGRYFAPLHLQPCYLQRFKERAGRYPITEAVADRTIALPFFNAITDSQIDEVCDTLMFLLKKRQ